MKLKFTLLSVFILIYSLFLYLNTQSKDTRIELALEKQIKVLETHYALTMDYFLTDARSISSNVLDNKKVIDIFSKAQKASKEQRDILREELHTLLTPMYNRLQSRGILQWQFVFTDNTSFLRMHKPSKYGDDLTDIRYSFKHANETNEIVEGFEQGRTTHAFRYVFPFYDKQNNHLGAVEISLSSYALQEKLLNVNKIHSHFLIHKDVFSVKEWDAKKLSKKYIQSIEHDDYMFALTEHSDLDALTWHDENVIYQVKDNITQYMPLDTSFALYTLHKNSAIVIAFVPIKETTGQRIVAYIVSYTENHNIYNINKNYRDLNIIIFISMLILFYFTYRNLNYKRELELEVQRKTKDLKNLNENLESKIADKTKELRDEKEHIETIVESNNNAIIAIDWSGEITTYNQKAQEIFGWSKDEMLGSKNLLKIIPSKYKQKHTKALANYFKTGVFSNKLDNSHQVEGLNKDGEIFPIRVSIGSIFKSKDTIIIANITDISQEKKQEELINQQAKMVAMGEMIGNIAHQWRQPLTIISMCTNNMMLDVEMDEVNNESLIRYANDINGQAKYLSQTIDDFRNFIKGDRVKITFTLKDLVQSFLTLVQGSAKNNNVEMILDLQENVKINGYQNELTQCMINIFNNAKDVLKEKVKDNRLIFISGSIEEYKVIIKIKDNAGGISDDILHKIFEPYFTTKHQKQGTGLGLHMTYKLIVDGMKGSIEVSNKRYIYNDKDYVGAEFVISLPLN